MGVEEMNLLPAAVKARVVVRTAGMRAVRGAKRAREDILCCCDGCTVDWIRKVVWDAAIKVI